MTTAIPQTSYPRTSVLRTFQKPPLVFTRPSRHGGPAHEVAVDPDTLRPLSCTCVAGQVGTVCWAALDVAIREIHPLAWERYLASRGTEGLVAAAKQLWQVNTWAGRAEGTLDARGETALLGTR